MTEIRPFRGLRYDPARVRADDVVAPPYDVVGADDVAALLARSPYNAAHIESCPGPEGERFERAAAAMREWIASGVLVRDEAPAYYVYEQRAAIQGVVRQRRCFFARVRLHQPADDVVRPHEATMSGPREERLRLLRATHTNVSPIFAMFHDTGGAGAAMAAVAAGAPVFDATDGLGDHHRLWIVADAATQGRLTAALAASKVTIADGHHRYATSLTYLDERLAAAPLADDAPERYMLVGLIPEDEPGLVILPNHRLVRIDAVPADFFDRLGGLYEVEALDGWGADAAQELWSQVQAGAAGAATFGLLDLAEQRRYVLRGRSREAIDAAMPQDLSPASRALSARVLTETILGPALGIDAAALSAGQVQFTANVDETWQESAGVGHRLAFLINSTRPDEVTAVADAGELMPQKTTFYYPKLATGMVFNPLD
ncbi:MAG: DUF1015 domain-containing protein [Chloroflexi bacterium]|nr:DUF1015 domain-containing protein [Chloroflexota bacterium]